MATDYKPVASSVQADDVDVPVFGGNGGIGGIGGGAGRSFVVQPDSSALRTDTDAEGTQRTSTWIRNAHGQWEKHVKDNV
jgi:hypothetical protein